MSLLIALLMLGQAAQAPAAIAAAKNASAQVSAAQKKNSEALEPNPPAPAAQPPSPGPAPQPGGQPAAQNAGQPAVEGAYTYDASGRRDPFVSLLLRGGEAHPTGASRPAGLPGLLITEISVKGVLKAKGAFVAILQAPDNKTYLAHSGDKVMDGAVRSITQDAVVFSQDVNDPLSLVKQREVRKTIRPETR